MPNWCYNNITITHESEREISKLEKLIEEWTSKDYAENGFGHDWLGNIVGNSGIDNMDNGDFSVHCRGSLCDIYSSGNQLIISTETAWSPMLEMWIKIVDKYLPGAEITYTAEECGNELYYTNDPLYIDKYVFDVDYEGLESNWEASEEYIVKQLQKVLNTDETNLDKLQEMIDEKCDEINEAEDKYVFVSIHKWEDVDIYELD